MIYGILLGWITICAGICFGSNGKVNLEKNKKLFLKITLFFMAAVMGLRSLDVGQDTYHYQEIFNSVVGIPVNVIFGQFYTDSLEIGYVLLMKICGLIGNYYFFQIVTAIILYMLLAKFLYDNTHNLYMAELIYLGIGMFGYAFNITRQMIAVMIVANCWSLLNENKKIQSILLLICATLIHTASFVFLIAYLIYLFRNNKHIMRLIPAIGLLMAVTYGKWISFLAVYFPKWNNYYVNERDIQTAGLVKILWVIIAIIAIYVIYKRKSEDHMIGIFSLIYVLSNMIGLYFNYFERVGLFFCPFLIVLFETFSNYIRSSLLRLFYSTGVCVCFAIYFILSMQSSQYTYHFFGGIR